MKIQNLSLDLIEPPVVVERAAIDTDEYHELVQDIRSRGLLQSIIVRPVDGRYRVVAGYRRYRAAQDAGLLEIAAIVQPMTDVEELATRFRENAHRVNPGPVEEGALFAAMLEGLHITADGIAEQTGKSVMYVRARLELVYGPPAVRDAVADGSISFSVARELLRCPHPTDQERLLGFARSGGCTAALMHRWVDQARVERAAMPAGTPSSQPVVGEHAPPIPQGLCEWHEGPMPLDGLLSFRVCPTCYQALRAAREGLKATDAAQEAPGATHREA